MSKKTVCVDLDDVLAQYDGWKGIEHIGDPIPGAQNFMLELSKDYEVVVYTTRCNPYIDGRDIGTVRHIIAIWLRRHNFKWDYIYCQEGKPKAIAYIDDRAVSCRPQEDYEAFIKALKEVRILDD